MEGDETFELDLPPRESEFPPEFKDRPFLRVYLASALTGREAHKDSDDRIRDIIRRVFTAAKYHRLGYVVHDPALLNPPGSAHSAEEIYAIDFESTIDSDLVVFFLNCGSLGMGEESQIAAGATLPRVLIYAKGAPISRMFLGIFNPTLFTVEFGSEAELEYKLVNAVASYGEELFKRSRSRRAIVERCTDGKLPKFIFKRRVSRDLTLKAFAAETGITVHWLAQIERDSQGKKAAMLTWLQLQRIKQVLDAVLELNANEVFILRGREHDALPRMVDRSLDTLYDAYASRKKATDDDIVLGLWRNQIASSAQSVQLLTDEPVSREEWLSRFEEAETERFALRVAPNYRKLPSEEKTSIKNLYIFCEGTPFHPSQETILAMWEAFRKDRRRRKAARKDQLTVYSVEHWQTVFNELDLHK